MSEVRQIASPQVGHFLIRLVKDGPEVPACICYEASPLGDKIMAAFILNERVSINDVWLARSRVIDQAEYVYRLRVYDHAVMHEPNSPAANPRLPVDLNQMRSIF